MAVKLTDTDQWLDAMAPVVDVSVPTELRAGVKANLKTAAKMAALLDKVDLRDDAYPAPVYRS